MLAPINCFFTSFPCRKECPPPWALWTSSHSIAEVMKMVEDEEETFIIGGAAIYKAFLPWVKNLYLTWVYRDFEADVYFPVIDESVFRQVHISERFVDPESGLEYAYAEYVRRDVGFH